MNTNGPPSNAPRPGRMGLVVYARMLCLLAKAPMTHEAMATAFGRNRQTARELLYRMEQLGVVHITGWTRIVRNSSLLAVFSAGPGESVPYPTPRKRPIGSTQPRSNPRPELVHFAAIVKCLFDGVTRDEVHELTGVAKHRFTPMRNVLRAAKLLHIAAWEKSDSGNGMPAAVWKFGSSKDAPRPKPRTAAEKNAKFNSGRNLREAGQRITHAISGHGAQLVRREEVPA